MKTSSYLFAGLVAAAAFASQPASAKIANFSYYVPGDESYVQQPSTLNRVEVKSQTVAFVHQIHEPRTEFGFASHDTSKSVRTRAEVKEDAREAAHTREYFTY